MKAGLFGERPPGVISVVEPSMSRWYAHRARVAFFATAVVTGLVAVAVLSSMPPLVKLPLVPPIAVAVFLAAVAGAACGLVVAMVVRAWPVLRALWWWSLEIVVTGLLVASIAWLAQLALWLALAVLGVALGVLGLVRPVRHRVVALTWCVIVRHRLRFAFAEFIRATARARPASLPLILWARTTPAGERVWVWLRPGLDLSDLEGKTGKLAVTCWAGEVRVVRASTRYAALVRIDVTRRDPLTGLVVSPLAQQFGPVDDLPVPVSPGLPPLGLDLDDVPEPEPEQPRQRGR